MAEAGADILVPHMGLTTGGDIGASTALKLAGLPGADRRHGRGRARGAAGHPGALPRRPDRHAGRRRLRSCAHTEHCHGFYGASSMERLPTEQALTATTRASRRSPSRHPRENSMPKAYASTVLNAPADEVWAAIRDFNGLPAWHPRHRRQRDRGRQGRRPGRLRAQHASQRWRPSARAAAQLQRRRPPLHLQFREDAVLVLNYHATCA